MQLAHETMRAAQLTPHDVYDGLRPHPSVSSLLVDAKVELLKSFSNFL